MGEQIDPIGDVPEPKARPKRAFGEECKACSRGEPILGGLGVRPCEERPCEAKAAEDKPATSEVEVREDAPPGVEWPPPSLETSGLHPPTPSEDEAPKDIPEDPGHDATRDRPAQVEDGQVETGMEGDPPAYHQYEVPELEACPYCHSRLAPHLHRNFDYVECVNCGARGHVFDGHPEDAVAEWNCVAKRVLASRKDKPLLGDYELGQLAAEAMLKAVGHALFVDLGAAIRARLERK